MNFFFKGKINRTNESAYFQVDGGAWRVMGTGVGGGFPYPDFLLSDQPVTGVKATKKSKL